MFKSPKSVDSKEVGLELGLVLLKFFLKSEYLHYGYFSAGLPTSIENLKKAQEQYTDMLISTIPVKIKSILDVGCGSGKMAHTLLHNNYAVDCVSPSTILTNYALNMLGDRAEVFNKKYQDLAIDKKYDLILFSESFQYMPMEEAIQKCKEMLNPAGYIIICDFFQTDAPGKSPLGGGHKLAEWEEIMEQPCKP